MERGREGVREKGGGRENSITTEIQDRKQKPSGIPPLRIHHWEKLPPEPFQSNFIQSFLHKVQDPYGGIYSDCSGKHGGPWGDDLERLTSWMPAHSHIKSKHFTVGWSLRVM